MNFDVQDGGVSTVLSHAILLYSAKEQFSSKRKTMFATFHDIADVGTTNRPNHQIMPGTPVTANGLMETLGTLGEEYLFDVELFPEMLLSHSPLHMLWWRPAGKARVYFNCAELQKRSAIVPHPALLFAIKNRQWSVFALKESKRPTLETTLYHAPYFNVYDGGGICVGSAAVPDKPSPSTIPRWESAFFDSEFTHVNGSISKTSHPRGEYALWKELLDGKFTTFPTKFLVPNHQTLGSLLRPLKGMEQENG